jgi:hypothetical protein
MLLLLLFGSAIVLGLLITGIVYAGGTRRSRRYRPGRPFPFTPVWFLASPERQIIAGSQRELAAASAQVSLRSGESTRAARGETGGASDRW